MSHSTHKFEPPARLCAFGHAKLDFCEICFRSSNGAAADGFEEGPGTCPNSGTGLPNAWATVNNGTVLHNVIGYINGAGGTKNWC